MEKAVPGAELAVPEKGRPMGVGGQHFRHLRRRGDGEVLPPPAPGHNADVELLAALSAAECASVPHLFGWAELEVDGEACDGDAAGFVPNSADGWS